MRPILHFIAIMTLALSFAMPTPSAAEGSPLFSWPSEEEASPAPPWVYAHMEGAEFIPLTELIDRVKNDDDVIRAAFIRGGDAYIEVPDPEALEGFETTVLRARRLTTLTEIPEFWDNDGVEIEVFEDPSAEASVSETVNLFVSIFISLLFAAFIIANLFFMFGGGKGMANPFTLIPREKLTDTFDDVGGIDLARSELEEIVGLIKDPKKAQALGGRMPKGMLLEGPPGVGKTLVSRALAKEAGVNFLNVDSTGFNTLWVGIGTLKVRRLFRVARKKAPCIIFIDEIDALAGKRSSSPNDTGKERNNTLNALLTELDGFEVSSGIFLVAATNRKETLDPAILRTGRIDRSISVTLPDISGRQDILEKQASKIPLGEDVDFRQIASTTYGFSGSDLANLINEAALSAARSGRDCVTQEDFVVARDRHLLPMGSSQRVLSDEAKEHVAIHEAGHALIVLIEEHADPLERATIAPMGNSLGHVLQTPIEDLVNESMARLRARIRVAVAGRVAEEFAFGSDMVTTGAEGDIAMATNVSRAMVTRYGMSKLGFVRIDESDPLYPFLAKEVLKESSEIIKKEMRWVKARIQEHSEFLMEIANLLKEEETISGKDVEKLAAGHIEEAGPKIAA